MIIISRKLVVHTRILLSLPDLIGQFSKCDKLWMDTPVSAQGRSRQAGV